MKPGAAARYTRCEPRSDLLQCVQIFILARTPAKLRSVHDFVTLDAHKRRSALATMSANATAPLHVQVQVECSEWRRLTTMQVRNIPRKQKKLHF